MQDDATMTATDGVVIEWAPFRLAPGASEAALLAAAESIQREFLERRPGYVRRELLRGDYGRWVDLIVWRDEASAQAAMQAAESSDSCRAYFGLMTGVDAPDPGSGLLHLRRVRAYEAMAGSEDR